MVRVGCSFHARLLGEPDDPKKHVPKLLAQLKQHTGDMEQKLLEALKGDLPDVFPADQRTLDWEDSESILVLWALAARLNKKDKAKDRAIAIAFERANLDVRNPVSWRVLLEAFCWAHFGQKGRPGKPIFWTSERYCQLLRDVAHVKAESGLTEDKAACEEVLKLFRSRYRVSVIRLQKALREARDYRYNRSLVEPVFAADEKDRSSREVEGKPLRSRADRTAFLRRLSRMYADQIESTRSPGKEAT